MKILYISDVPVQYNSFGGPIVIHKLLESLQEHDIKIICTNLFPIESNLKGASVSIWNYPLKRLFQSRFSALYSAIAIFLSPVYFYRIKKVIRDFSPDIVLTISHGIIFFSVSAWAKKLNVPYAIIHHDVYQSTFLQPDFSRKLIDKWFSRIFGNAINNLCVSPYLEGYYKQKYAGPTLVLYPGRSMGMADVPSKRINTTSALSFCYFGSIHSTELAVEIINFAHAMDPAGHSLHLIGSYDVVRLQALGLKTDNILCHDWFLQNDLEDFISTQIDALVIVQESNIAQRISVSVNFPSKFTEYTRYEVPIVVYSPEYSSSAKFCSMYPDTFVSTFCHWTGEEIRNELRMLENATHRKSLALKANFLGASLFSAPAIRKQFCKAINQVCL